MVPLGNFNFSGKDLSKPQIAITNDSQIASLGDQVGNFAGLGSAAINDSAVSQAIKGLGVGWISSSSVLSDLSSGAATIAKVAQDATDAINTAANALIQSRRPLAGTRAGDNFELRSQRPVPVLR